MIFTADISHPIPSNKCKQNNYIITEFSVWSPLCKCALKMQRAMQFSNMLNKYCTVPAISHGKTGTIGKLRILSRYVYGGVDTMTSRIGLSFICSSRALLQGLNKTWSVKLWYDVIYMTWMQPWDRPKIKPFGYLGQSEKITRYKNLAEKKED